ncbi:MAG: hypothetical protein GY771_05475 [bacterium]|nr:hypothetical protein [bacterium]
MDIKRVIINSFLFTSYLAIAFVWLYQYPFQAALTWWIRIPGFLLFLALTFLVLKLGRRFFKKYFYVFVILVVLIGIIPNIIHFNMYEPETCGISRAEAAESFSSRIINLEYPYRPSDLRGVPTSGLPVQYLLQTPFYLLGEIGIYMILVNVLLAFFITRFYGKNIHAIFIVILLFAAPPVIFDTGLRSDLIANSALIVFLFLAIDKFRPFGKIGTALLFGTIIGLVALTRTYVAIPLAIMFIGELKKGKLIPLIVAGLVAFAVFALVMLTFYIWDPAAFAEYNPFQLQNRYLPAFVKITVIIIMVITAFLFRGRENKYILSFIFVGIAVLSSMVTAYIKRDVGFAGIFNTRIETVFDIHYFCLVIPFLLFSFIVGKRNKSVGINALK